VYISPYCRLVLVPLIFMKLGIRGQLTDVITGVKFLVYRFRGYGVLIPPKLPFPIDLPHRPYNSVRTNVLHCDSSLFCCWILLHLPWLNLVLFVFCMFDLCDLLNIICFDGPAILCCVPIRMIHYITTASGRITA